MNIIVPIPEVPTEEEDSIDEEQNNKDEWISTSTDKAKPNKNGKQLTSKEPIGAGPSVEAEIIWTEKSEPTHSPLTKQTRKDAHPMPPIQVETVTEEEEDNGVRVQEENESPPKSTTEYLRQNATFAAPIDEVEDPEPTRTIPKHPPPTSAPPPDAHKDLSKEIASPGSEKAEEMAPAAQEPVAPPAQTQRTLLRSKSWTSSLTKGIRQLEIWHQRLGHPSPAVLQKGTRTTMAPDT